VWRRGSIAELRRASRHLRVTHAAPVGFCARVAVTYSAMLSKPALRAVLLAVSTGSAVLAATLAQSDPIDLTTAAAQHGAKTSDAARAGIWKAATPPSGSMHGEFKNDDPVGLAAGAEIPADCSLNWIDPDFKKLYCFSSATSLVYFLESPRAFLARAQKNWVKLNTRG
jgi:hypothetical protein